MSQNAFKGGWRQQFKELRVLLKEQDGALTEAIGGFAVDIQ